MSASPTTSNGSTATDADPALNSAPGVVRLDAPAQRVELGAQRAGRLVTIVGMLREQRVDDALELHRMMRRQLPHRHVRLELDRRARARSSAGCRTDGRRWPSDRAPRPGQRNRTGSRPRRLPPAARVTYSESCPATAPKLVRSSVVWPSPADDGKCFASPKSSSFTSPPVVRKMLPGVMSR